MWRKTNPVRHVDEEEAYFDEDERGDLSVPIPSNPQQEEEDEIDPLDAFMEDNNQETMRDLVQSQQKASMLQVDFMYPEKTSFSKSTS